MTPDHSIEAKMQRPIVTKTKIIRYRNNESNMSTCVHLEMVIIIGPLPVELF